MPHLLCAGDSITDCGRLFDAFPLGDGYVKMTADRLSARDPSWQVTNRGCDGFTAARLLESAPRSLLPLNPDIVTILIGVNDIALMMLTGRTEAQKQNMLQKFFRDYAQLLSCLDAPGRRFILMEPFLFPSPAEYLTWLPCLRAMSEGISRLALDRKIPYLRLHEPLNQLARSCGAEHITKDGIHLTKKGHAFLAEILLEALSD